jgi:hypothetical protein
MSIRDWLVGLVIVLGSGNLVGIEITVIIITSTNSILLSSLPNYQKLELPT